MRAYSARLDWNWNGNPAYESEHIRIDSKLSPVVFYDMKLPRQIEDREVDLMLSLADAHLERGLPFLGLVRHRRGTGVIAARHRHTFADWLGARGDALQRDDFGVVVVVPEPIVRAVLRVVYRFRHPPLHTVTTQSVAGATVAVRSELTRRGHPITPEIDRFLDGLSG